MYERIGHYSGDLECFIQDVMWNPPGWGSAVITQSVIPARLTQLMALKPGGVIPLHSDDPAGEHAIDITERIHLVLQSNPYCWSLHDGIWQQLEVGGMYRMDPYRKHAAVNWGDSIRYHLVIDR